MLFGAFAKNNSADGAENDTEVEPNRPVLDIIKIECATLSKRNITTTGDLGEAGESRFD